MTLNELWAGRVPDRAVVFHAMHPGWADTPGVEASLPTFRRVVGPLLRTPAEGADTMVWLAADDGEPLATSGRFWLDRRVRSIHRLPAHQAVGHSGATPGALGLGGGGERLGPGGGDSACRLNPADR